MHRTKRFSIILVIGNAKYNCHSHDSCIRALSCPSGLRVVHALKVNGTCVDMFYNWPLIMPLLISAPADSFCTNKSVSVFFGAYISCMAGYK